MAQISRPHHRNEFEIALICALRVEHDVVEALLDENYEADGFSYGKAPGDHNAYTLGRIGNHYVVLAQMPGMGKANAAGTASSLRTSFNGIKLGILVGICGGVPKTAEGAEILLGDVVISTTVIQIDLGRQYPHKFVRKDTLEENLGRPNWEIRAFLERTSGQPSRQRVKDRTAYYSEELCKEKGLEYPGMENDKLYEPHYRHKHQFQSSCTICAQCRTMDDDVCEVALNSSCMDLMCSDRYLVPRNRIKKAKGLNSDGILTTDTDGTPKPSIHFGRVASGDMVMKCGQHRDDIAERERVIAFEMEGAGMWEYLPTVVIKSVCDYADSHKSKKWQRYAAITAAACTKAFLEEWRTTDRQDAPAGSVIVQGMADPSGDVLN
jgi:nucleoside phosphorylase